jgi:radical SAM protein with 4Fe4S-binding SPASM domain
MRTHGTRACVGLNVMGIQMYAHPFWTFEALSKGEARVTNSLTGKNGVFRRETVDALTTSASDLDGMRHDVDQTRLAELKIIFESRRAARDWMDELDDSHLKPFPLVDQIELTNRCPYTCKMCPRTSSMTRALGDMPFGLFERIIDQIAPHQSYVALHHFGESLLYRSLADAVSYARDRGVATGLSCNPPSLKPQIAARLLDAGISELVISFDSLEPDTYREIRGPAANLAKALKNLDALMRIKESGGHATKVTLQLIMMRENATEAEKFLEYCSSLGVDRGVVVRLGRWDFTDDKLSEIGDFTTPLNGDYCHKPATSVAVLWDGRVVPCCHDYNGAIVLGNLKHNTLKEIWESDSSRAFRQHWNATSLCRTCAFSRSFREDQHDKCGSADFHRAAPQTEARLEYVNPTVKEPMQFDGFDIASR